jgi:hypothetical protein
METIIVGLQHIISDYVANDIEEYMIKNSIPLDAVQEFLDNFDTITTLCQSYAVPLTVRIEIAKTTIHDTRMDNFLEFLGL